MCRDNIYGGNSCHFIKLWHQFNIETNNYNGEQDRNHTENNSSKFIDTEKQLSSFLRWRNIPIVMRNMYWSERNFSKESCTSDQRPFFHLKGQGFLLQWRVSLGLVRFCRLQYSSCTGSPPSCWWLLALRDSLSMHVTLRVISPWSQISEHWKHTKHFVTVCHQHWGIFV